MIESANKGTLVDLLGMRARERGAAPAILAPGRVPLTYQALFAHIEQACLSLGAMGIRRTSRVAISLAHGPELGVAMLAVMTTATAAPLDPETDEGSFREFVRRARIDAVLALDGAEYAVTHVARSLGLPIIRLRAWEDGDAGTFHLAPGFTGRPSTGEAVRPDDVALLLRTSGTVSGPKIVPLTHAQILSRPRRTLIGGDDRCICVGPLYSATALGTSFLGALLEGASVVVPWKFRAEHFHALVAEFAPTYFTANATVLGSLVDALSDGQHVRGHSLRFLRSTSSSLPARVQQRLEEAYGVPVIQAYSTTETGAIAENPLPPGVRKAGSVGLPLIDLEIRGPASDGRGGPAGEILVRSPRVMSGYEDDPEANAQAFSGGWFRTGDEGYVDADGYLYITGRTKEIVNRGGTKVVPEDVEATLLAHPEVRDAAVFALPHPTMGEDLAAAIVLHVHGSVTAQQIRAWALDRLPPWKVPTTVTIVDALERNAMGKVSRRKLASTMADARQTEFVAPRDPLEATIAAIFTRTLKLERVGVHDNFFELGGDSLRGSQAAAMVASELGTSVSVDHLFRWPTVAEMAARVAAGATDPGLARPPIRRLERSAGRRPLGAGGKPKA